MSSSDIPVIILDSESSQVGPNGCDRRRVSIWSVLRPLLCEIWTRQKVAVAMRWWCQTILVTRFIYHLEMNTKKFRNCPHSTLVLQMSLTLEKMVLLLGQEKYKKKLVLLHSYLPCSIKWFSGAFQPRRLYWRCITFLPTRFLESDAVRKTCTFCFSPK